MYKPPIFIIEVIFISIYYDFNKILSYNALLNFIIGERGVGKTFGIKKYSVNHFLKKHKQFCYIRRYKTELKQALLKNGVPIFFDQIKDEFPDHTLSNKSDTFYIDKKLCGFAIPLSTANILKSSSFEDVDTIIFDEFLIDKGSYHYLTHEAMQLLDVIETVARLRDVKVFFLGNAISVTNPYFAFFDLSLPYNSEFKTFKDGLIVVNYIKNLKYRETKKNTRFGKLIADTEYGEYAIDNEFLRDSKSFIKKKTGNCKFYFKLYLNNKMYGIWVDYVQQFMYVSYDYDINCPVQFSVNPEDHNESTLLLRVNKSPFIKNMFYYFEMSRLCFENQNIKNIIMNFILKHYR